VQEEALHMAEPAYYSRRIQPIEYNQPDYIEAYVDDMI